MTTKLIQLMPVTNRMKVRDWRQLKIDESLKIMNVMWWWHVYDAHSKWQLTDPGPSLISRPIPTAFLLLPSFILQPMKFSSFSQTLLLPLLEMVKRSSTIKEIQRPHYLIDQEYHKTEQMLSQAAFKGLVGFKQNFFGVPEFPCSCPVGNCFISSVDCWHINLPLLKHNDYPITQLLLSLERSSCYWEW